MKPQDASDIVKSIRIDKPGKFRLKDYETDGNFGLEKDEAKALLAKNVEKLSDLQARLYAQDRWSVLIVLQAMDAAGKDGVVAHVMSGVNPQGCQVHAFKAPSPEELDHDFLWRTAKALPERGRIGLFNRSHYEEVLVVRVHPEILGKQRLPQELTGKDIWKERFESIRNFERHLARNGTLVLKFFLNVSREEQRKRFLERLDEPAKRWKFSMGDVAERKLWDKYMDAYEDMIRETSTDDAPWHVVPADRKYATRVAVSTAIIAAMEKLGLEYPRVEGDALKEMLAVRSALEADK